MVVCLWKTIYGYWEIPHQTGTNNRGLKPIFSENHEIWHRDTVKIRKRAKFDPCNLKGYRDMDVTNWDQNPLSFSKRPCWNIIGKHLC